MQESNTKRKQKNLPLKTPKKRGQHSERSSSATFWDVSGCFKMLRDVSGCFGIFWETSCNQSKPYSKKATHSQRKIPALQKYCKKLGVKRSKRYTAKNHSFSFPHVFRVTLYVNGL